MINEYINELIDFKETIRFISQKGKVLVANINNGERIFISEECYNIVMNAIKEKYTFRQLLDCIVENESKQYMICLLNALFSIRAWNFQKDIIKSDYFQIDFEITNNCNLNCRHCCRSAGDNLYGEDLLFEDLKAVMQKVINLNPFLLTLSGGEPLVRRDFKQLVQFIRSQYNGKLGLMTNAVLIDKEMAQFISRHFDKVDVSIDGGDEESCRLLRGEGTFEKCVTGILNLQNAGFTHISASMVITSDNVYAKESFIELCNKLCLHPMLRRLDYVGRAKKTLQIKPDKPMHFDPVKVKKIFIQHEQWKTLPQIMTCQGAKLEFFIDHTGNIYPCGTMVEDRFILGNALKISDLKSYLEGRKYTELPSYKLFESYKPCHIAECKDCKYNLLCFSCVREVINGIQNGTIHTDCQDKKYYFDLYWENYETD